jgi:hypothetical protein
MNEPVVVLNRNFEPLSVCNTRRAVGLLMVGKAELAENGRGPIHTTQAAYPRPGVIRLMYLICRPRPRVKLSKREILRRDNYRCPRRSICMAARLSNLVNGRVIWKAGITVEQLTARRAAGVKLRSA